MITCILKSFTLFHQFWEVVSASYLHIMPQNPSKNMIRSLLALIVEESYLRLRVPRPPMQPKELKAYKLIGFNNAFNL